MPKDVCRYACPGDCKVDRRQAGLRQLDEPSRSSIRGTTSAPSAAPSFLWSCYWIGGDGCREGHYFVDGPMHQQCTELSMDRCPFQHRTRPSYRGDDLKPMPVQEDTTSRPAKIYLMRGGTRTAITRLSGRLQFIRRRSEASLNGSQGDSSVVFSAYDKVGEISQLQPGDGVVAASERRN